MNNMRAKFPLTAKKKLLIKKMYGHFFILLRKKAKLDFGSLDTPSLLISKIIVAFFSFFNINHLGNWSGSQDKPWGPQLLERDVISFLADLYGSSLEKVGGYVSSGGSESNLYLGWLGRQFLKKRGCKKIGLIQTSLTHYSVGKSGEILDVPCFEIGLNEKWGMDDHDLEREISSLKQKGYDGFLICLTLGYSSTGSSDDIEIVGKKIQKIEKKIGVWCFLWVDAALNGLIEPFVNLSFKPLSQEYVQGIVVDFHKIGGVPPTASVVLYKQTLRNLIEKDIQYLRHSDATLLGGRPGVPALAIWSVITYLGKAGFAKRIERCFKLKKLFIQELKKRGISFVTSPRSLTIGLLMKENRFNRKVEQDYSLYFSQLSLLFSSSKKKKKLSIYKVFILPHLNEESIESFFVDIDVTFNQRGD